MIFDTSPYWGATGHPSVNCYNANSAIHSISIFSFIFQCFYLLGHGIQLRRIKPSIGRVRPLLFKQNFGNQWIGILQSVHTG
uniref:Uncharacterized protein n=1 Tax=Arundo donax TaxID=35708 RepID=A0A0A9CZ81_ARUDO